MINEVKVSDVGVYQCMVQSLAGEIYRKITIKKIVGKMIFNIFFQNKNIKVLRHQDRNCMFSGCQSMAFVLS